MSLAVFVAVALAGLLLGTGRASAHSVLVSSSPADGSRLAQAPTALVLTFNEKIQPEFSKVSLTGPAGALATEEPVAKGAVLTTALPTLAAGSYRAAFRVVSADGHPISGVIAFTVLGGASSAPGTASPTATMTPTSTPTTTPTPTTTATASAAGSASPSVSPSASSAPSGDGATDDVTGASTRLIQLVGLLLVAGLAWFTLGRLRGRSRDGDHG